MQLVTKLDSNLLHAACRRCREHLGAAGAVVGKSLTVLSGSNCMTCRVVWHVGLNLLAAVILLALSYCFLAGHAVNLYTIMRAACMKAVEMAPCNLGTTMPSLTVRVLFPVVHC
jgi:hypothetical protein